jgi:hypothetical protein
MNDAENFRQILIEKLEQEKVKMTKDYLSMVFERNIPQANSQKHLVNRIDEMITYYEMASMEEIQAQLKMFGEGFLGEQE